VSGNDLVRSLEGYDEADAPLGMAHTTNEQNNYSCCFVLTEEWMRRTVDVG